jgi:hypothetical protein
LRPVATLVLSLVLAFPALISDVQPARASCYEIWSSNVTTAKTGVVNEYVTFTISVTYKLSYDSCNLSVPWHLRVVSFRNTMAISGAEPHAYHADFEAGVMKWYQDWDNYQRPVAYWDDATIQHQGNGTWTRADSPGLLQIYDSRAAVFGSWQGCNYWGIGDICQMVFRFLKTGPMVVRGGADLGGGTSPIGI